MRCFIGLDLSTSEKLALDSWRQQALPEVMPRQWTRAAAPISRKSSKHQQIHQGLPALRSASSKFSHNPELSRRNKPSTARSTYLRTRPPRE
jgi:hypothetical protein